MTRGAQRQQKRRMLPLYQCRSATPDMKLCTNLLIGILAFCLCAAAQDTLGTLPDSEIALLRSDIQTKKTDILQQNLRMSDEQAAKFWPLQRSYENDLSKLEDQHLALIREYTKDWNNLKDETAKDLGRRLFEFQKKRVELRSKYFDRMSKEISPAIAAKFFRVEIQMEDAMDFEVGSSMPLIK